MEKYFVQVQVHHKFYITTTYADSSCGAEHAFLDRGICGRHDYGVNGALAFRKDEMNTESFFGTLLGSEMIGESNLVEIIEARNEEIRKKDEAEDRFQQLKRRKLALRAELDEVKMQMQKLKEENPFLKEVTE